MKTNQGQNRSRARRFLSLTLRASLAVILLGILFHFVSFSDVGNAFLAARFEFVGGAILLVAANLGLQMLKWRYFVRLVNPASSTYETAASLLFGITLGAITPGQIGEFGGRALRQNSLSTGAVIGLTLVDRLQMLCVMGIAGTISLVLLLSHDTIGSSVLVAVTTAAFLYPFFNPQAIASLVRRLRWKLLDRPWMQDFLSAVAVFHRRDLMISLAYSSSFYAVVYFQMFLLLNAFSDVGLADAFLGFAAMMFLKALVPVSLGDLGIREASAVYFYSLRGIAHAAALDASLLLFVINILLPSLLGLIVMPKFASR